VGKPGELRPLGVAALEDKIVQRATVEVLNAIYEQDFLGFSYGFRPGRSPHQALDALAVGIGEFIEHREYLSSLSSRAPRRHYPRWEPDAVTPLVRICGGGREQP